MKKTLERKKAIPHPSVLRFSPSAWAKLLFLRDIGETEIGGFGVSAKDDLLLIEDIELIAQECSWVHVAFDDEAVAGLFERQVAAGRQPEEFARIWIHTHPGRSAEPSGTDEATFARVFGRSDWAVMFILARGGQTFARLRYNVGPGIDVNLPVEVEYGQPFAGSNITGWQAEYETNVRVPLPAPEIIKPRKDSRGLVDELDVDHGVWWRDAWDEYAEFDGNWEEAEYGFVRDF